MNEVSVKRDNKSKKEFEEGQIQKEKEHQETIRKMMEQFNQKNKILEQQKLYEKLNHENIMENLNLENKEKIKALEKQKLENEKILDIKSNKMEESAKKIIEDNIIKQQNIHQKYKKIRAEKVAIHEQNMKCLDIKYNKEKEKIIKERNDNHKKYEDKKIKIIEDNILDIHNINTKHEQNMKIIEETFQRNLGYINGINSMNQ